MNRHMLLRRHRAPRGLSLVEVLISLAIAAMLFTSLAFAVHAGITSERINREYARNVQTARGALYGLTTAIRTAQDVDVEDGTVTGKSKKGKNLLIQPPVDANGQLPPAAAYRWDGAHGRLVKYKNANDDRANPQHGKGNAAGSLTDVDFKAQFLTNPTTGNLVLDTDGNAVVSKVTISLVVGVDPKTQVTLSGSASPRRAVPVY